MRVSAWILAVVLLVSADMSRDTSADARPYGWSPPDRHAYGDVWVLQAPARPRVRSARAAGRHARPAGAARRAPRARPRAVPRPRYYQPRRVDSRVAAKRGAPARDVTFMPHPDGCPARAFCGCGVSLFVFGERVRSLYLAANWLRFPRAEPGPGMVAARRGHVMAIIRTYGDGTALVYNPNGGGRRTTIRRRSLAGFRVVNPHGGSDGA